MTGPGAFSDLLRKSRGIWLGLAVVQTLAFGTGFLAGKRNWTSVPVLRTTKIFALNRDLEYRVPGFGPWFQNYRNRERVRRMALVDRGHVVAAMFQIYFDNWIVSSLTTTARSAVLVPQVLFPYARFAQGVALAQAPSSERAWLIAFKEFGGVYPITGGALVLVLWTLFAQRLGFPSRRKAFAAGLKTAAIPFAISGVVLLMGSYLETMTLISASFR
jgi:hypothetical protein